MSASSERAYAHIRAAILSGRYRSGSRLTEDMVANELGVSRTPIRDALRRLQVEQLITVTPYSGARVASWSEDELRETAEMRVMLESFATGLAASKRSSEDLDILRGLCARMEEEVARKDPDLERISQDNLGFHRAIVDAAKNTLLTASLEPLWNLPVIVRKYALFGRDRLLRSLSHHKEMVTAIEKRDVEWSSAIMRVHILAARSYDAALSFDDQNATIEDKPT